MRTVLITGAGRNIGRQLAESFAADGHRVVLNARSHAAVEAAAEAIRAAGGRALAHAADVRDRAAVQRMVQRASDEFGGVDVLVNAAVVRVHASIAEMTPEQWRAPLDVVLDGAFNCVQACLPHMVDQGWGRIINLGGITGQTGAPNRIGVVTAKSGLMGFTKALALEVAADGVTANVVSPGAIDTDRGEHTSGGDRDLVRQHYAQMAARIPVGRLGTMRDVVAACRYLAAEDAGYVTGQTLAVSGGRVM